jgi:hypothetical protein
MSNDRYYDFITNASLDEIDIETLPNFDERNGAGEFKNMTDDEIKQRYIQEAIDQKQADDFQDHLDSLDDD